jgi:hypothetical protein
MKIAHHDERSDTNQSGSTKAQTYQRNEKNGEFNHCQTPYLTTIGRHEKEI